jgi:hypothetical protein
MQDLCFGNGVIVTKLCLYYGFKLVYNITDELNEVKMYNTFEEIGQAVQSGPKGTLVVAAAAESELLRALSAAFWLAVAAGLRPSAVPKKLI